MHLTIDSLHLRFGTTAGHEHRVRPITRRALELLHLRLRNELLVSGARLEPLSLETLTVPPLKVDLRTLSDEAAAVKMADAMYTALYAHWREG